MDVHSNESEFALLSPPGVLDAPQGGLPRELALGRPAPNPAGGSASVRLALPHGAHVALVIHDLFGREVRHLLAGAVPAGERAVTWDLRDASGARVADGIYFIRLEVEGRRITRRLAVVN